MHRLPPPSPHIHTPAPLSSSTWAWGTGDCLFISQPWGLGIVSLIPQPCGQKIVSLSPTSSALGLAIASHLLIPRDWRLSPDLSALAERLSLPVPWSWGMKMLVLLFSQAPSLLCPHSSALGPGDLSPHSTSLGTGDCPLIPHL